MCQYLSQVKHYSYAEGEGGPGIADRTQILALGLGGDCMSTQEDPPDGKPGRGWELGYKFHKPTYDPGVWDSSETQVEATVISFLANTDSFMINQK